MPTPHYEFQPGDVVQHLPVEMLIKSLTVFSDKNTLKCPIGWDNIKYVTAIGVLKLYHYVKFYD